MRIGGLFYLKVNGRIIMTTEGEFTYNLGKPKRSAEKNGALGVAGFVAEAQIPYIDGEIYDKKDVDVESILTMEEATVTLELYNGKTVILSRAAYCGDGEFNTKGRLKVRFEGMEAELVA